MKRKPTPLATRSKARYALLVLPLVFGVAVVTYWLPMSRAATFTVGVEAEAGNLTGASKLTADGNASGGKAVSFAGAGTGGGGGGSADGCTPQPGKQLQDQDMTDSQLPWKRTPGQKVTIYFETKNMTQEYMPYIDYGIQAWAKSPCLDPQAVASCPANANCVTMSIDKNSTEADGNFDAVEKGGFTTGGHITMYAKELDPQGAGAKKNVTVHEMGHAVGLRHRKTDRVLMNGDTYDDVFDPDAIDFQNLLVLYGNQT